MLELNKAFSFIRIGDFEFALLEDGNDPQGDDEAWKIAGTEPKGSTGLDSRHREDLIQAIREADFVDFLDLNWPEGFEPLQRYRAMAKSTCSKYRTSYILGTWVEHYFKDYCRGRRVLFCGAEAPILENLCKDPEYLKAAKEFFDPGEGTFFLRPREDGRNLANNLSGICADIASCVRKNQIDTVFLSLGAGAKILCLDLARELKIHAIDFGAFMRALCYSGSDGNRAARSTHSIFLFSLPFLTYMGAVEKAFPNLKPEEILAKAHAQLLMEIQQKEVGWTHSAWEGEQDRSRNNLRQLKKNLKIFKKNYYFLCSDEEAYRNEQNKFMHYCKQNKLKINQFTIKNIIPSKVKLKATIRRLARTALMVDIVAKSFENTLGAVVDYARIQRKAAFKEQIERRWLNLIKLTSKNANPFKNLNYEGIDAHGSAMYPKIIGTYESELRDEITRLGNNQYDLIVDIGCAEGYYAVGLAQMFPGTPVKAYDIDASARKACKKLADRNGVGGQVQIQSFCSDAELQQLCEGNSGLVICDCEGFEEFVLNQRVAKACFQSDLIVEVHDCFYPGIGDKLQDAFSDTHNCIKIAAVGIKHKKTLLSKNSLELVPEHILNVALDEHRPSGMYWLILENKSR